MRLCVLLHISPFIIDMIFALEIVVSRGAPRPDMFSVSSRWCSVLAFLFFFFYTEFKRLDSCGVVFQTHPNTHTTHTHTQHTHTHTHTHTHPHTPTHTHTHPTHTHTHPHPTHTHTHPTHTPTHTHSTHTPTHTQHTHPHTHTHNPHTHAHTHTHPTHTHTHTHMHSSCRLSVNIRNGVCCSSRTGDGAVQRGEVLADDPHGAGETHEVQRSRPPGAEPRGADREASDRAGHHRLRVLPQKRHAGTVRSALRLPPPAGRAPAPAHNPPNSGSTLGTLRSRASSVRVRP